MIHCLYDWVSYFIVFSGGILHVEPIDMRVVSLFIKLSAGDRRHIYPDMKVFLPSCKLTRVRNSCRRLLHQEKPVRFCNVNGFTKGTLTGMPAESHPRWLPAAQPSWMWDAASRRPSCSVNSIDQLRVKLIWWKLHFTPVGFRRATLHCTSATRPRRSAVEDGAQKALLLL